MGPSRSRLFAIALVLLGCSTARADHATVLGRHYYVRTPAAYDPAKPTGLLLFLHPYAPLDGEGAVVRFALPHLADEAGLIVVAPDGLRESDWPGANRFWNATDWCCDKSHQNPNDVAYLVAVLAAVQKKLNVDPKRIFVAGYSNGGYMTHRMLCERPDLFAAGASLAGAGWFDSERCQPSTAAALLEIHGDHDEVVPLDGRQRQPASRDSLAAWARKLKCGPATELGPRDVLPDLPGAETTVTQWACAGGAAELWTVHGGTHRNVGPSLRAALEFLLTHPKK